MIEPLPLERVRDYSFRNSPVEMYVAGDGIVGHPPTTVVRTGITAPGYPERPCYGKAPFQLGDPVYVLDYGQFWPSREWHEYYLAHRESPALAWRGK